MIWVFGSQAIAVHLVWLMGSTST